MATMNWKDKATEDRNIEIYELKKYLSDTDFYYIRQQETGKAVPQDVKATRISARQRLNDLGL